MFLILLVTILCWVLIALICYLLILFLSRWESIKSFFERNINRYKAIRWKKRNVKNSIGAEKDYTIYFNLAINDRNGNFKINKNFSMVIPANAKFFARKNLENHIRENITIIINSIE